ncbi:MAG: hypothetical protein SF123_19575 [Chloroflexota bacterium]|nr:hypothetical protein [Chloroflexota bacterium]
MSVLIAVPSKGRAARIATRSMRYLPDTGLDVRVFVEPQDADAYRAVCDPQIIVTLDDNDRGLGYVKCAIKAYAIAHDYRYIVKHDDDLQAWSDGVSAQAENKRDSAQILRRAIDASVALMDSTARVDGVSFNYRAFMHVADKDEWSFGQRLQTVYIVRRDSFYADTRVSVFEDLHNTLMIWLSGKHTARYNFAGMYMSGTKFAGIGSGGLQSNVFDRAAMAQDELMLMQRVYPALKFKRSARHWGLEPDLKAARRDIFGMKR